MRDYDTQIGGWMELLHGIRQENAMFKFQLSELVDKSVMSDFLSKAEKMHNELIANDQSLELLVDSASHLQAILNNGDGKLHGFYTDKLSRLEQDVEAFRKRFSRLKVRFNNELRGEETSSNN